MSDNDIRYCRIPKDVAERWRVVLDIISGDQVMRAGGYLPYLNRMDQSDQNIDRNNAYRTRAVLYTATGFTLSGLIGLAFRHDPKTDLPAQLDYLTEDCDGTGISVYQQAQQAVKANVSIGRHGLFVDYSATLKRPIIKSYNATDIINWRYTLIGGKSVLSLVVLRETAEAMDGYASEAVDQWRELYLNELGQATARIWQLDANGEPQIVQVEDADGNMVDAVVLRSVGAPLDAIPFDFIGSENNDAQIDPSPLYGLAMVNVAHFRNSADYEDSVFFVGQAQPWISGLTETWRDHMQKQGGLYIGSRAPMLLPEKGAFGFAQALPNMLAMEAMTHKEQQMIALGARVIQQDGAVKTATESEGQREASTSVLSLTVSNVTEAYQGAIAICARYLDLTLTTDETFKINQDFADVTNDPLTITALVGAWQAGVLAKTDVRSYFRRQGTIATERTDEMIDADLALQPPVGPMAADAVHRTQVQTVQSPAAQPVQPVADFAPLLASIQSLLVKEQAAPVINVTTPDIVVNAPVTVNVPDFPAINMPSITVNTPDVTVAPATVNVTTPEVTVNQAAITVNPPAVTVEAPVVNVAAPVITVQPAPPKSGEITFATNAAGDITGASMI